MAEQLQKASPNYHKWLTPEELGSLYGPVDSDIEVIVAWLEAHGLRVDPVSPARTNISFSGTVNQIEEALHVPIHSFEYDGQEFYANTAEPQIPSALAGVVTGIARLNTYKPRPHHIPALPGMGDRQAKRLMPAEQSGTRPELTEGTGPNSVLFVVPADAATMYDTPNSLNLNFSSATGYTGTGVTIGIGGDAAIQASTVVNYRTLFLGSTTAPIITNVDGVTSTGDADEAYIDMEISGGLAPAATIHFYTGTSIDVGIEKMLNDNSVDIFSLSFGACELDLTTSDNAVINGWWQQAATQGIAVTVSTGDGGAAGCDNNNTELAAVNGLAVSGWASTPYNIAVGGTDTYALLSAFPTYVSPTNGTKYGSALKFIPESTWNNSTSIDTTVSANVPRIVSGKTNIVADGGGASSCSTSTVNSQDQEVCVTGYRKPTWQRGTGVPNDSARDLPDISLMAGAGGDLAAWLVCTDDVLTVNGATVKVNCSLQGSNFYFAGFGGTSTSAPALAGILALVQQNTGSRLGTAAKELYDLYNGTHASAIFHDTTIGNNSVYCTESSPNCVQNTAGNFFLSGYDTGAGYDLATGMGSVDVSQLINYWSSSTGSGAANVGVSPGSSSITIVQPLSVPVTVTGNPTLGTPTGTVTLTSLDYTSQPGTLTSGTFTFSIPGSSLPAGTDKLIVTYSGDSNYSTASGSSTIIVNLLAPTVSAAASPNTFTTAQSTTVTVTVAGTGGTPTGTVTLTSGSYSSGTKSLSSGSVSFSVPAGALPVGTDTITASYSGDPTYGAATAMSTVTVTPPALLTPTVTVTPVSTSIDSGQSLNVTAAVTGSAAKPTGSVTLSGGGYTSAGQTLNSGSYTFTIPANSLSAGSVTLTVNYGGDTSYATGMGSATVMVTQSVYALAATAPAAISPGGTATSTISLTSSTAYTATVTLTCALTSSPMGAVNLPNCAPASNGGTIAVNSGTASGTGTMNVTSTPMASSAMKRPRIGAGNEAGGALLALLVLLGIPARRRGWRVMLGVVVLMLVMGGLGACTGGSSNSSGGGNSGTTAGKYEFTVTGTGSDPAKSKDTATFTVTVN